jgi:hypothetical protein
MFAKAEAYTGPFCCDLKSDSQGHLKLLECNMRFCGALKRLDGVNLQTFVPLALALLGDAKKTDEVHGTGYTLSGAKDLSRTFSWAVGRNKHIYQHIGDVEAALLKSGGCIIDGSMVSFKRYNNSVLCDGMQYNSSLPGFLYPKTFVIHKPQ